ncbi:MAG: hypothetical protein O6938_07965, partial [Gammaproteobacteria bacterium]|nr:hypothetical protein [Gammaproteobacteria bacterium]
MGRNFIFPISAGCRRDITHAEVIACEVTMRFQAIVKQLEISHTTILRILDNSVISLLFRSTIITPEQVDKIG